MKAAIPRQRSDFLASVIERAQERAPVVAPRPTSLFEPVAAAQVAPLETDETSAPAMHAPADDAQAEARNDLRQAGRHRPQENAAPVPDASRANDDAPIAIRSRRIARPSLEIEAAGNDVREPAPASEHPLQRSAAQPPLLVSNEAARPALGERGAALRSAADGESRAAPMRSRSAAEASEPAEKIVVVPQLASLLPNREIAASIAPHNGASRDAVQPMRQAATGPTVTISIGRVEVRAGSAAPAPSQLRAKSTRQPMRLDEYLARKERTR